MNGLRLKIFMCSLSHYLSLLRPSFMVGMQSITFSISIGLYGCLRIYLENQLSELHQSFPACRHGRRHGRGSASSGDVMVTVLWITSCLQVTARKRRRKKWLIPNVTHEGGGAAAVTKSDGNDYLVDIFVRGVTLRCVCSLR